MKNSKEQKSLIKQLANKIISSCIQKKNPIIAIDGYAGSGKSYYSKQIAQLLPNALILETDLFLKHPRNSPQRSCNDHCEWYDFDAIKNILSEFKNTTDNSISLCNKYNHLSGKHDLSIDIELKQNSFLILDGMYSGHIKFIGLIDYLILIHSDYDLLFDRVLKRDKIERNISEEQIFTRYSQINGRSFNNYLKNFLIQPNNVVLNNYEINQFEVKYSVIH